ncbi:hypothetical protein Acsp03_70560 [Actinomadura sp. NBRC 104412]|uniref:hypothetical protein n=1 Tax=Actinomadura sp. NBRC 104412 TaxID=3032203 RepID=UPI0024A1FB99|nr:hypothetical protein [Actinomadura sp. NBRC 104412]GLZ09590.1 hypothetical protein Acsp03_70560 [Actinomadura sp. NBRC 104412]
MIRDGYVARWLGREFEASPGADGEVRLYAPEPTDGFEEMRPGRFRRVVPFFEVEELRYVRTTCVWRGERFVVVGEHDGWLRVEYTGGRAPVAEGLGLDRVDHGVWQAWAPRTEIQDLQEDFS